MWLDPLFQNCKNAETCVLSHRFFLQKFVKLELLRKVCATLQINFRRQPPVSDEDFFFGLDKNVELTYRNSFTMFTKDVKVQNLSNICT